MSEKETEHEGHDPLVEFGVDKMMSAEDEQRTAIAEAAHAMMEAAAVIQQISASHGFWDSKRNKGEMIALMHSELSEMLEAVRTPGTLMDKHIPTLPNEAVELADLIIRALDYAHGHNLPLDLAFVAKVMYNDSRPRKHGKEF